MTSPDLAERVLSVIARTQDVPRDRLRLDSSFEELGFDSLDGFNILFALEEEFDIDIPDDAAREATSLADIVAGIESAIAARRAGEAPNEAAPPAHS